MVSSSSSTSRVCPNVHGESADLSSYRLITSLYPMEMDYEGETVMCSCKLKSPRWCAWTESNPGRRFYGCQRYPDNPCGFLQWHDDKFSTRAIEIINELRVREKYLYQQARMRSRASRKVEKKLKFENERLRSELDSMEMKSDRSRTRNHFPFVTLCLAVLCFGIGIALGILF